MRPELNSYTVFAKARANLVGGELSAMKEAMLKEFGHFDPEFVRVISYVGCITQIRTLGKMSG